MSLLLHLGAGVVVGGRAEGPVLRVLDPHDPVAREAEDIGIDDLHAEAVLVHVVESGVGLERAGVDLFEGVEGDRSLGFAAVGADRAVADLAHHLAVLDDPLVDTLGIALDAQGPIAKTLGGAGGPEVAGLRPVGVDIDHGHGGYVFDHFVLLFSRMDLCPGF